MRDKTEITIDRGTGLAWRDGKILGRRNWEVHTETSITIREKFIVKAANVEEAMEKGLNSKETLLGHLFCSKNSLYFSDNELPPYISEGNKGQHNAYKILQKHRVALVQGLPGSGKTRLMISILNRCQHLKATWLAETNDTCDMLAYKAKRAG